LLATSGGSSRVPRFAALLLGRTGNAVLARLPAIVLAAFATQSVLDGIKGAFPSTG